MSQPPDVEALYAPWDVRLRGARVFESYVGTVDEVDDEDGTEDDRRSRFELLLGIDSDTDDDESRIAIVGRFSHVSTHAEVQITCIAPIYVKNGVQDQLETAEGRWQTLLKYSGLAVEVLWDFCRSSANAAVSGSFTEFDIPNEMPDPILIKPVSLKD